MVTKARVLQWAKAARDYWGVSLEVKFVPTGSEAAPFSMVWGEVTLDDQVLKMPPAQALREVNHEWSHRSEAPGTQAAQVLWEAIATEEGVAQPGDFTNVMTDGIIEHSNTIGHSLGVCPWAKTYAKGLAGTLKGLAESDILPQTKLLRDIDQLTLAEYNKRGKRPKNKLALECYDVLFADARSRPNKIRELARLTKHLFKEPMHYGGDGEGGGRPGKPGEPGAEGRPGSGKKILRIAFVKPLPGARRLSKKECAEVAAELAKLYGEVSEETRRFLASKDKRIIRHMTLWSAYTKVIPIVKKFAGKHENPITVAASKWNVGMPLKKLDVKATISKYGAVVPGITTLARMEVNRTTTSTGLGNVALVIDASGSMSGEKVDRVVEAGVGLVETAKHFGDQFSVISIMGSCGGIEEDGRESDRVVFEPSRDYPAAVNSLLDIEGHGDCLARKMMNLAVDFGKQVGKQLTMILSDNYPPDNFCDLTEQVRTLSTLGPIIFVVFTEGCWQQTLNAIKGIQNASAVLVEDPTKPFTWEILDPVWKGIQTMAVQDGMSTTLPGPSEMKVIAHD